MLVFFISQEETRKGGTLHHSRCPLFLNDDRQESQKLGCFFQLAEAIAFATAQGSVPVTLLSGLFMRLTEMEHGMRKQRAGNIFRTLSTLVLAVMVYGSTVCPVQAAEVTLNSVQREYLNTLINHQLRGQGDRDYVQKNWTEAQRVAEFICRPLAQQFVKQTFASVDKVILDQGAKNTQHLRSATLLTGNGQYRTGHDWTSFHYECVISGQTGEALEFRLLNRDILTMAPGPVIPGKGTR